MVETKAALPSSVQNQNRSSELNKKYSITKRILFSLVWIYVLIRVFITDVDAVIADKLGISNVPLYAVIRLLFISLIIIVTWIRIGNSRFWRNVMLFFVFPLYPNFLILIKKLFQIPKYLYQNKKTTLLFYCLETIITFLASFKSNIAKITLFLLGIIGLAYFKGYWLIIPICTFSTIQIMHLYKRVSQSFSPIKFFGLKVDLENEKNKGFSAEEALKSRRSDSETELNKEERTIKEMEHFLMLSVLFNSLGSRMKHVLNNKTYMISFLGKGIFSFILSIICFGGINYALYKINPHWYRIDFGPNFFDFIYYSFFTIFSEGVDIEPVTTLTKMVRMAGVFVGVIINLIILGILFNNNNERYQKTLSQIMTFSQTYNAELSKYFQTQYGYTPTEKLTSLDSKSQIKDAITFIEHVLSPRK